MSYFINEDRKIMVDRVGIYSREIKPIEIGGTLEDIVSYLNALKENQDKLLELLKKLLMCNLDGRNQNRVQDEVAKTLNYPGIDGFISEIYGSKKAINKETKDGH